VFEDSQGVLDELVAAPTKSYVQQIQAKRPTGGAPHVEMHHLRLPARWHQAQGGVGEVAVGVDQHHGRRGFRW